MKITVINVTATERSFLYRYDVIYEVERWSWLKFRKVVTSLQAFKQPGYLYFRDSNTGEYVDREVDLAIYAFMARYNIE